MHIIHSLGVDNGTRYGGQYVPGFEPGTPQCEMAEEVAWFGGLYQSFVAFQILALFCGFSWKGVTWDTVLHHCVFFGVAWICSYYFILIELSLAAVGMEVSTIFLNLVQILNKLERWKRATVIQGKLFAASFFFVRTLFFGYCLLRTLSVTINQPEFALTSKPLAAGFLPRPYMVLCAMEALYLIGYFLQLFWLKRIVEIALAHSSGDAAAVQDKVKEN